VQYGTGLGIVAGIITAPLTVGGLPSTSTDQAADPLVLLYAASLLWMGLLVLVIAVIAVGLFRIARIPS
jgi:hypothetical protein